MKIEKVGSRYAEIRMTNEFTTFLDPIPETEKIAKNIMKQTDDTVKRLELATKWVYENIRYETDWVNYGKPDFFASPAETLKRGAGDCEDMAMLICSIANSFKPKPTPVYLTIGYYSIGIGTPSSYHAWAYCGGAVCEGTAGFVTNKEDARYHPILAVHRDHISLFKPVSYYVDKGTGIDIGAIISQPIVGYMAASIAAPFIAKGAEKAIDYFEKKRR